jgi:hypothetical protein
MASADGLRWSPPSYAQKVEASPAESSSKTPGWILLGGGLALDIGSFVLAGKADDAYRDYQAGTDPATLAQSYDDAVRYDRWASATLIVGQVAIGAGLYYLLIKHPKNADSGDLGLAPLHHQPRVSVLPGGLALTVRF